MKFKLNLFYLILFHSTLFLFHFTLIYFIFCHYTSVLFHDRDWRKRQKRKKKESKEKEVKATYTISLIHWNLKISQLLFFFFNSCCLLGRNRIFCICCTWECDAHLLQHLPTHSYPTHNLSFSIALTRYQFSSYSYYAEVNHLFLLSISYYSLWIIDLFFFFAFFRLSNYYFIINKFYLIRNSPCGERNNRKRARRNSMQTQRGQLVELFFVYAVDIVTSFIIGIVDFYFLMIHSTSHTYYRWCNNLHYYLSSRAFYDYHMIIIIIVLYLLLLILCNSKMTFLFLSSLSLSIKYYLFMTPWNFPAFPVLSFLSSLPPTSPSSPSSPSCYHSSLHFINLN